MRFVAGAGRQRRSPDLFFVGADVVGGPKHSSLAGHTYGVKIACERCLAKERRTKLVAWMETVSGRWHIWPAERIRLADGTRGTVVRMAWDRDFEHDRGITHVRCRGCPRKLDLNPKVLAKSIPEGAESGTLYV